MNEDKKLLIEVVNDKELSEEERKKLKKFIDYYTENIAKVVEKLLEE